MNASTIYNVPRVKSWIGDMTGIIKTPRHIWNELRFEIYKTGNSEECHEYMKYSKGLEYVECALRRNQRMEYLIPKYPLHQVVKSQK